MTSKNKISTEEVKYLSELIRIEINEKDIEELKKDLGGMLDFVSQMNVIDVSNFEPLFSPLDGDIEQRARTPMAEDTIRSGLSSSEMEANAPNFRLGHFVVPRVIED